MAPFGFGGIIWDIPQVERFFKETMKIPRYAPRLDCMIFKYGFERDARDLKEILDIVSNACRQVRITPGRRVLGSSLHSLCVYWGGFN